MRTKIPDLNRELLDKLSSDEYLKKLLIFESVGMGTCVTPLELMILIKFAANNRDRIED